MNSGFEIITCKPDDVLFSDVVSEVYREDSRNRVADDIDKDLLHSCLAILYKGRPAGRLAIYHNNALTYQNEHAMQLGNFECINDSSVASALLHSAMQKAKGMGATFVIGPMNGSTWNQYRFTTSGDHTPLFFTEQIHPAYYPLLWQDAGFRVFQEYSTNMAPVQTGSFDTASFFASNHLSVRGINVENLDQELRSIYPICAVAFAQSPLYTPISSKKFVSKMATLGPLLQDSLTRVAVDEAGVPVAFILCLPNICDSSGKTLVLKTAAKHPDCHIHGVASALYQYTMKEALTAGYKKIIHAFMHVDSKSLERSRELAGREIRRYGLYIRSCL